MVGIKKTKKVAMSELQRILEARRKRNDEALHTTATAASGLDDDEDDEDDEDDDDDYSVEGVISRKGGVVLAAAQVESPALPTRTSGVSQQQRSRLNAGGNVSGNGSDGGLNFD